METPPLTTTCFYDAPISRVWEAITNREQMAEWYFDLPEFKAEKGFVFRFTGGDEKEQYLHVCELLEVDPPMKLSHSWTYPDHNDGYSIVTWQLSKEDTDKTKLQLTHAGLETFPAENPNFSVASFTQGWQFILGTSLKKFLEQGGSK